MNSHGLEMIYYSEPETIFTQTKKLFTFLIQPRKKTPPVFRKNLEALVDLSFDALNPLLAKQLTEVEMQLGQLAQVQAEIAEERRKMHEEMKAIRALMR